MTRRYDYDHPPSSIFFFLQIYTIHVNDLFQGENGEFRRKVTSLHPWFLLSVLNLATHVKFEKKGAGEPTLSYISNVLF